jgi:uncharacterized membrane protein YiaA
MTTPRPELTESERRERIAGTLSVVSVSDVMVGLVLLIVGLAEGIMGLSIAGGLVLVTGFGVLIWARVLRARR